MKRNYLHTKAALKVMLTIIALIICMAGMVTAASASASETEEFASMTAKVRVADGAKLGGEGSESSPYLISSADHIIELMNGVNDLTSVDGYNGKHFRLTANIDLAGRSIAAIGNFIYPFKGSLDGDGYAIQNLTLNDEEKSYVGLFGVIGNNSKIENLSVYGNIKGGSQSGGIVGLNNGSIVNCTSGVTISNKLDVSGMNLGGIAGNNNGTIIGSVFTGVVNGHGANTGGITGNNGSQELESGTVTNCINKGKVASDYYSAGGIAGNNSGIISGCVNNAEVTARNTVGGIAGANLGTIENAYNTANIAANEDMAGGIAGSSEGAIYNAYSSAEISGASSKGGVCGFVTSKSVIDSCYYSSDKFSGRLTNRGDDYPNSAALRDVDITTADALDNEAKMKALAQGRGVGVWTKRGYDSDSCYLPEIKQLSQSDNAIISQFSKESVTHKRQRIDTRLGQLSYTYDGTAHEPEVYKGDEKLVENLDYTIVYERNINAGTAIAKIEFINYYLGAETKEFSVNKRAIAVEWSVEQFYYNSLVQHPTASVVSGVIDGEILTLVYEYDSNINAGEHSIIAKLEDNEINNNYALELIVHKYEIDKVSIEIEWLASEFIYNNTVQYPTANVISQAVADESVTLIYSGFESNIGAGIWSVRAELADNETNKNYDFQGDSHSYSITEKAISVTISDTAFIYNGMPQYPKVAEIFGAVGGQVIEFNYSGYEDNIGASDDYEISVNLADTQVNKNYAFEEVIVKYSIEKAFLEIEFIEEILIYNGKAQQPRFNIKSGLINNDNVTFLISDCSNHINASLPNYYTVTISLSDTDINNNYDFRAVSHSYGIEKRAITIEWDAEQKLVYNGTPQRPNFSIIGELVSDDNVTFDISDYSNNVNAALTDSYAVIVNIGDGIVNDNYIFEEVTYNYNIEKCGVEIAWGIGQKLIYNGALQRPNALIVSEIYDELSLIYADYSAINFGVDYTVNISVDNDNYLVTNSLVYDIHKRDIDVVWEVPTFYYNGAAQYPSAMLSNVVDNEKPIIQYCGVDDNSDVGVTYSARVVLAEGVEINNNYNILATDCSYSILPKEIFVSDILAVDRSYNGGVDVDLICGELQGIIDGDEVILNDLGATVADIYPKADKAVKLNLSFEGADAHKYIFALPTVNVDIFKLVFDNSYLIFADRTVAHDGEAHGIELSGALPSGIEVEYIGNNQAQVGKYLVTAKFVYDDRIYEPIGDMTAYLCITQSLFSNVAKGVSVEIISGYLEENVSCRVDIVEANDLGVKNGLASYKIRFYDSDNYAYAFDGQLKVTILVSDEFAKMELKLLRKVGDNFEDMTFTNSGGEITFFGNALGEYMLVGESSNSVMWVAIGASLGGAVLLALCVITLVSVVKRRRNVVLAALRADNIVEDAGAKIVENGMKKKSRWKDNNYAFDEIFEELKDFDCEFVLDGITCNSLGSFLASLCYRNQARQREICSMPASAATKCATGKGYGNRRDLYWNGDKIILGSTEFKTLINRVKNQLKKC